MPNSSVTTVGGVVFDAELVGGKNREAVVLATCTSGGVSTTHRVLTNDTNSQVIKASPGQVYHVSGFNKSGGAVPFYVKLYDKASAAVAASDTPKIVCAFPPDLAPPPMVFPAGIEFTAGIAILVVLGVADTDTAPIAVAGDGVINIGWK